MQNKLYPAFMYSAMKIRASAVFFENTKTTDIVVPIHAAFEVTYFG
jgi:hypothetical protein